VSDENHDGTFIVDAGAYNPRFERLINDKKIEYILLTHGHFDHILGVDGLKKTTGAKVVIHKNDAEHLLDPKKSLADGNFPHPQIPVNADITVSDGDVLTLGTNEIKVMHTPGHTKGGVCYLFNEDRVMFSGDTLFRLTAGRADLYGGNGRDELRSLVRLRELEGDYTVYPGHDADTTLEFERQYNRYMRTRFRKK
jgi:glyoxylase-like metal-dependent hydrolase (beta-lactamase superfamily II)